MDLLSKAERAQLVGDRVRRRREAARLNKSQLATYAGVSRAYVTRLEKGQYVRSSAAHLEQVARVLNCTLADLVGVEQEGEIEMVPVLRPYAPVVRRLLDLNVGPQRLWDVVEGVVRMLRLSGEEPHHHIFSQHAEGEGGAEGHEQAQSTEPNGAALCP